MTVWFFIVRSRECLLMLLCIILRIVCSFGLADLAAVWQMTREMAREGDKLCDGFRKSENFGNEGGRGRKRK